MDVDHFNTLDAKRSVSYSHYTFPGFDLLKKKTTIKTLKRCDLHAGILHRCW